MYGILPEWLTSQAAIWIVSPTMLSLDGKAKDPVVVQLFRLDVSAVLVQCWSPEEFQRAAGRWSDLES